MKKILFPFNGKLFLCLFLFFFGILLNVTAQKTGDFRSIKNGLWTDSNIWQTYKDTAWINASRYPTYHDKHITIQDDTITIRGISLDLDQVAIINGLLYLKQHAVLHLRNTNGNDLVNNGIIDIYNSTIDLKMQVC